ncbi:MAG: class I SAM-dependent methyltransferase [Candidatus Omnitrophica bacterium]|nr:class I SAM-dependent methyltransferase [Candidatus Omnitrophota bacterium]
MNRIEIVQKCIDVLDKENYLEIGVCHGDSIRCIGAKRIFGVDPKLFPEYRNPIKRFFKRHCRFGPNVNFFEMTSDAFFGKKSSLLKKYKIGVAFVDGLHTHEQALRDVMNCLDYLDEDGVIIMHDCNPLSEAAACVADSPLEASGKDVPGWTGEWNGDVWKAIVSLRSFRNDLRVCVLDCDQGVGVIRRGEPVSVLGFSEEEIEKMSYGDLAARRQELLNLKDPGYLEEFLGV